MTPRIRPATEEDVPRIQSLAERIWNECYAELLSQDQRQYMLSWMYASQKLTSEIRRGVDYRILEVDGEPAGYVASEPLPDGSAIHVNKLYLMSRWHGRGLGQLLLEFVFSRGVAAGFDVVELRVNRGNARALRAYARAGFETVGSVVTDIGSGYVMDDFILRKRLGPPGAHRSGEPSR